MTRRFRWLFMLLVAVWVRLGAPVHAFPNDCADVCTSGTTCTETCYPDELAFINGNAITCLQWGTYASPCCGDGSCNGGETASSCFSDCHCPDGACNAGETTATCPQDCTDPGGGGGPGCGNGTCDAGEGCDTCVGDCHNECGYCGDGICSNAEIGGSGSGHENQCNPITSTWCSYCPEDCGYCEPVWGCDPGHGGGRVCNDTYGKCRDCVNSSECAFSDEVCNPVTGTCVVPQGCQNNSECEQLYGTGWFCNQNDHQCKPPF